MRGLWRGIPFHRRQAAVPWIKGPQGAHEMQNMQGQNEGQGVTSPLYYLFDFEFKYQSLSRHGTIEIDLHG